MKEFFLESKKILCLATEHDNLLMWSHYADSHKGICIEYTPFNENEIARLKELEVFGDSPNDRLCLVQNAKKLSINLLKKSMIILIHYLIPTKKLWQYTSKRSQRERLKVITQL